MHRDHVISYLACLSLLNFTMLALRLTLGFAFLEALLLSLLLIATSITLAWEVVTRWSTGS